MGSSDSIQKGSSTFFEELSDHQQFWEGQIQDHLLSVMSLDWEGICCALVFGIAVIMCILGLVMPEDQCLYPFMLRVIACRAPVHLTVEGISSGLLFFSPSIAFFWLNYFSSQHHLWVFDLLMTIVYGMQCWWNGPLCFGPCNRASPMCVSQGSHRCSAPLVPSWLMAHCRSCWLVIRSACPSREFWAPLSNLTHSLQCSVWISLWFQRVGKPMFVQ